MTIRRPALLAVGLPAVCGEGVATTNHSGLVTLTFDILTLKMVPESRVTWATSVPILVFLGLSVLDLGSMYATDRDTSDAHHS